MTVVDPAQPAEKPVARSKMPQGLRSLLSDPMGLFGLVLVLALVFLSVFADVLAPFDPAKINVPGKFQTPNWTHLLGTDELGRDVFSRALYGGRVALKVALITTFAALGIGTALGFLAAYGPRWLDNAIVLFLDTVRAYPTIIFALAVGPMFGAGVWTVIGILIATSVPYYGRIVRTAALSVMQSQYVDAERAMGANAFRVTIIHMLPNVIGPMLIMASMDIPVVITAEAGLSFLGVGIKPPDTSWGLMLDQGYRFINRTPWLVISAGIPLIIATLGFTFLGEAMRDAFDPKLRRAR
ncbi:MAG: ABC transporter permease [Alphaproteobacteria bacterium]